MGTLHLERVAAAVDCRYFGDDAKFHHVGLAVRSIADVCPSCAPKVERRQGVSIAFVSVHGLTIELLEPYGTGSPIAASLERGVNLLHLCFQVPNLEEAVKICRPAGFHRRERPVPTDVFENGRVVWVFSRKLGLFELLELNGSPTPPSAPSP